jgi:hypothetical protein
MAESEVGTTTPQVANWTCVLNEFNTLCRQIDRASLQVPAFSLLPWLLGSFATLKFTICIYGDMLLWLPINAVIFSRNLFPGRWRYRSFSGRYWRYATSWIWRGESPFPLFAISSPVVSALLAAHVYGRCKRIDQQIWLDEELTDTDRSVLHERIAVLLERWKRPTLVQLTFSYLLPLIGAALGIFRIVFPEQLPVWTGVAGIYIFFYAFLVVITGFMVKRALMLGAIGRAAYFPGAVVTSTYYSRERALLQSVGISVHEFPFDIFLIFIYMGIAFLWTYRLLDIERRLGVPPEQIPTMGPMAIIYAMMLIPVVIALVRRRRLGRW